MAPEVPLMPTLVKVAMPFTALTVAVPTVVAPLLTVMVTEAVLVVTVLPEASLMVITGWVVNAKPLGAPAAEVVMDIWVAAFREVAATKEEPLA